MKSNLINLNPNYFEDTTIIRDKWLSALLGDEIDLTSSPFSRIDTANFLMEEGRMIKACIEMEEDCDYRMTECFNTFNTENNFDLDFQYTVFWRADEGDDWLRVTPPVGLVSPHQGIDTYDDHRIAMCFSLAARGVPVRINDPGCVAKTFPEYFACFAEVTQAVPVIAIDGPSASGKGTIAAKVAAALGWHYLDSGALYRLTALAACRAGLDWLFLAGLLRACLFEAAALRGAALVWLAV